MEDVRRFSRFVRWAKAHPSSLGVSGRSDSFFPRNPSLGSSVSPSVGTEEHEWTEGMLMRLLGPFREEPAARERLRGLLAAEALPRLARRTARELRTLHGLPQGQARRLEAAFALGRTVERTRTADGWALGRPEAVHQLLAPEVRGLEKETFHALLVDARHRLIERVRISEGTLTASLVHPREVFGPALRAAAAAVVVAHNHPSGDPEPSAEDVAVTRRLVEVGQLLGVPLLDHVVLGEGRWVSLRERLGFG